MREFYYAHCPKCLSTQLSDWDEKYFFPRGLSKIWRWLGAGKHRCDQCRYNFFSFLPRKKQPRRTAANAKPVEREHVS